MSQQRGGYFYRVAIGFDQFVNTLFGGDPDETISAKCYRKRDDSLVWGLMYKAVNKLFFWQNNHCRGAYVRCMNGGYRSDHYQSKCKK